MATFNATLPAGPLPLAAPPGATPATLHADLPLRATKDAVAGVLHDLAAFDLIAYPGGAQHTYVMLGETSGGAQTRWIVVNYIDSGAVYAPVGHPSFARVLVDTDVVR